MRYLFILSTILLFSSSLAFAQEADCLNANSCGVSEEVIAEYPEPNVTQRYADDELLFDRVYRRMVDVVQVYDAPNGNIINAFGVGFNFVTVLSTSGEWSEISPGRWVQSSRLSDDVVISRFAGVLLPEEALPYPMGWILVNVYPSETPGGEPSESNPIRLRYETVNLYAAVQVGDWIWYQIGDDQWVIQTLIAKLIPVERPADVDTERWVSVDLYEQVAIAYEDETPVFATLVSSGLPQWSTNEGLFHIYVRYPRTLMSGAEGQSDFYYLEEVPWTMYFDDDIALHGTYWHDGFGYRHSHGCVNLSITDAAWLYEWASPEFDFTIDNDLGAAVYVYSSGVYQ
jgi:hypothetical protein